LVTFVSFLPPLIIVVIVEAKPSESLSVQLAKKDAEIALLKKQRDQAEDDLAMSRIEVPLFTRLSIYQVIA